MQGDEYQRENSEDKEKKNAAADYDPQQRTRAFVVFRHGVQSTVSTFWFLVSGEAISC
jgi:hypothetical protein